MAVGSRQLELEHEDLCSSPSCGCSLPGLNGDANGDCTLTVGDCGYISMGLGNRSIFAAAAYPRYQGRQRSPTQLHPASFGGYSQLQPTSKDLHYCVKSVAKKLPFVQSVDVDADVVGQGAGGGSGGSDAVFVVRLFIQVAYSGGFMVEDGSTKIIVRLEVGGLAPHQLNVLTGALTDQTTAGTMLQLEAPTDGNGTFALEFTLLAADTAAAAAAAATNDDATIPFMFTVETLSLIHI